MAAKTQRWYHSKLGVVEGELISVAGHTSVIKLSKPFYPHKAGETVSITTAHLTEMKERPRRG
jgi:hypothetical protein